MGGRDGVGGGQCRVRACGRAHLRSKPTSTMTLNESPSWLTIAEYSMGLRSPKSSGSFFPSLKNPCRNRKYGLTGKGGWVSLVHEIDHVKQTQQTQDCREGSQSTNRRACAFTLSEHESQSARSSSECTTSERGSRKRDFVCSFQNRCRPASAKHSHAIPRASSTAACATRTRAHSRLDAPPRRTALVLMCSTLIRDLDLLLHEHAQPSSLLPPTPLLPSTPLALSLLPTNSKRTSDGNRAPLTRKYLQKSPDFARENISRCCRKRGRRREGRAAAYHSPSLAKTSPETALTNASSHTAT